jgi:S-formylglutathione hydrolase FrmB
MRALLLLVLLAGPVLAEPLSFRLSWDAKTRPEPFTGRAYVMLFKANAPSLQKGVNWFNPEPLFAVDVKNVKPGETIILNDKALAHPTPLAKLAKGTYTLQAVLDTAPGVASFSTAPGNVYGISRREIDPNGGPIALTLDKVYAEPAFPETARVKLLEIESKLLSDFYKRPTRLRAGVVLPASYATSPERRYPVVYEIPGFGGRHTMALIPGMLAKTDRAGVEVIHVVLDPTCHHGHHVFADSANNGPCGQALVRELIPALEKVYRTQGKGARLVTGHSSGGWSSLWLQITYPDVFDGCWSTAPDPVDFRSFQYMNLYRPGENFYTDPDGNTRPLARVRGKVVLTFRPFTHMETVMGHGGQLASFEAVFSDRGPDGQPRRLWDRETGAIDTAVAKTWEKYDIRLVLKRNWETLEPLLRGKIHVYMGDMDTFYLEGATKLLRDELKALGSDAKVELFPGKDHSSVMDAALRARIDREMAERLKAKR